MDDWKSEKLPENYVQIARAVLGGASGAIPLRRKKRVPPRRDPQAKLKRKKRDSGGIKGHQRGKKEESRRQLKKVAAPAVAPSVMGACAQKKAGLISPSRLWLVRMGHAATSSV